MTTLQHPPLPARTVSPRLLEPLRIVAGRARLLAFFRAAFKLFALASLVWIAVVLLLGTRAQVPAYLALPLVAIAWLTVLVGGIRLFWPVFRRRSLASTAYLIDSALPDTEERLSSAIEFSQEKDPAFQGSPELIDCLIRQAEHHADAMNPAAVISGKDVSRWFLAVAVLFLTWLILLIVMTPNVLLGLRRTIDPFSAAAPLPSPLLDVTPGDKTISQGQSVEFAVTVNPPAGLSLDSINNEVTSATLVQHFTATSAGIPIPDRSLQMERTDRRAFALKLDNLQQPFTYRILADAGPAVGKAESPPYTVNVQTTPAVAAMQIVYTYPDYTHLPPRTDLSREGAIDGLFGTKVRVALQTTQPVTTAQLSINDPGDGPGTLDLTPLPGSDPANPTLAAEFTLRKSSQYTLKLINTEKRENTDKTPRPITVHPDALPVIAVTSPKGTLKVRPDDTVPIHFLATDDFGIARVEAVVQVDELPAATLNVPLDTTDPRVDADYALNLPDLIKTVTLGRAGAARDPKRITYQLKATDNRDPNPQSALSAKQTLDLDKNTAPLAQKLDTAAAKDLGDAIKKAADKLKSAGDKLTDIQKADTGRALTDKDKQRLTDAQKDLADARTQLAAAASQAEDTRLNDLAKQVRDVADQPLRRAEEETAKTQLASDQAALRKQNEEAAQRNVQEARDKLNQLANNLKETAKEQPLAQSLERLAAQQKQLADALTQNPNDPKLLAQQKDLQKQLENLIKQNPQLEKPAVDANQNKVNDLVKKLQQIEQAQKPLNDPLGNQAENSDKPKELARQQEQLNKQISEFTQQQADAIKQAGAKTPEPAKLDPIVKDLQDNKLSNAAREQNTAGTQLEQAANKLDNAQKKLDDTTGPREKAAAQAEQAAKDAKDLQDQSQKLAQQIQDAKNNHTPPTRPSDPANQQASKLADQLKKTAQQLAQNPAARQQAQSAAKAADAAKKSAQTGQAESAQQQLSDAANQLSQAAQAAKDAAGPTAQNDKPTPGQAAQQARDLATKQKSLAEQAQQLSKSQDESASAKSNAASTAQKQQALAERMSEAAKDAQSLQQQTHGAAPELSQRAADAAQSLEKAAQAQRDAAQSTQSLDSPAAASKQSQASENLSSAQKSLGSSPSDPGATPGNAPGNTPGQNAAQSVQSARNSQSQAAQGNAAAARQAAQQLSEASRQLMPNSPPGGNMPGGNPPGGNTPGGPPGGTAQGGPPGTTPGTGNTPGGAPGTGTGPGTGNGNGNGGVQLAANGRPTEMPKEVQEVGLSPSEWAKLPPTVQEELLHSAQQPAPPGYRDMIKSYYSKIARMQPDGVR